ncbi:probable cytochrome P450 9f2 [Zeugodacus cucurbitae]|uniref:Probable cytochrome P450 9f2 n=1 Tax=Zeugodacus cucurbitae TaxID=28588 RepID=A0A0A1WSM0_ZEUCU|nr:probable cytochrome P450 9f2 [Zeugodacus cucurbitae]
MLWETLILGSILLYLFYRWATQNFDFFEKRGIPYDKPVPVFGSLIDITLRRGSIFYTIKDLYNKNKESIYGIFFQTTPVYLIRDPELLRKITVKEFDHFMNHRDFFGDSPHDLFTNSLIQLKDEKWKDMRSTLSPAFTGSRLRQMFELINQVAEQSAKYLQQLQTAGNGEGVELELKDYATRFATDVIASTAFGLQVNSFENKDNQFFMSGKKATTFNWKLNLRFTLFIHFKSLMKFLKMELFDPSITNYFRRLVLDALKYRKEQNIRRADMINLLMEARGLFPTESTKSHTRNWTDTEMVAQCFIFFFAGFETVSTLICFAAHELMENPEVQEKVYQEIEEVNERLDGKQVTYEALQSMKYLDMVISETLRKWPGAVNLDRMCTKDIVLEVDGKRIEIKKGETIMIPVVGLQHDPQYFPNPEKFDPERFSSENKDNIKPFTYMPFGEGPRICIGSRFALLEAKAILYYLVRDFRIAPAKKSTIPMKLGNTGFQVAPKNGYWLKLISRSKQ